MSKEARDTQNKKRKVRARKVRVSNSIHIFLSHIHIFSFCFLKLFERRKKALLDGQEKEKFKELSIECMSDESSDSDGECMVVHKPVWRSKGKVFPLIGY